MIYDQLPNGIVIGYRFQTENWDENSFVMSGGLVAVVLNYNKAASICRACQSALEQDFPCFELIFMDDCSTDGSEKIMEQAVMDFVAHGDASFRGRAMKITIVLNKLNQSILGQWSTAVSISQGKWFGMFCGDDIAYPERMSVIHALIRQYPSAYGICTSALTNKGEHMGGEAKRLTWRGTDSERPRTYWLGCTSFWSRELLQKSFGRHNEDDFVLHWLAIVLAQGREQISLVWALDKSTVHYSVGSGITTELQNDVEASSNWVVRAWRSARAIRRRGDRFGIHTWRVIREFDRIYGRDSFVRDQIFGYWRLARIESGNWWQRLLGLVKILVDDYHRDYGGKRKEIIRIAVKNVVMFALGPLSYVICMAPGVFRRRRKNHG